MKKKLFDCKLYWENVKRLRIIGLAASILCLTVSILIPVYDMISTASRHYDFYETSSSSLSVTAINDNELVVPALVASYLMPIFVFFVFSYLNRRNESDFYHAIPYTRTCVYVSSMAAVMSWVWGILIASCLAAGAFWAINPYVTFSFVGLLWQMLYMCLNATLLVTIAAAAVSLMGTAATSLIAFGLLLCSWRFILYMALVVIDDLSNIVRADDILGGYLNPSFLLPVGLMTGEGTIGRPIVLLYAALVSVGAFLLGALFYRLRRSETAGRAVPNKWLQILVRCLLCLPTALLLTYQLIVGNADGGMLLIFLVITLIIFYLYELLTSKSVKSMFKATPWLVAVLGACVVFGAATLTTDAVVKNERIPEERMTAVSIDGTVLSSYLSPYEQAVVGNYMTQNDEIIGIVAEALSRAQLAERQDTFWTTYAESDYTIKNSTVIEYQRVWLRIRLVGGMTVTRRVLMEREDYDRMIEIIREEADITPIPSREQVKKVMVSLFGESVLQPLSDDSVDALLPVLRQEWRALDSAGQKNFLQQGYGKDEESMMQLQMNVAVEGVRYTISCYYYVDPVTMPRTYALMWDAMAEAQSTREEAEDVLTKAIETEDGIISMQVQSASNKLTTSYHYYPASDFREVSRFLLKHLDDMAVAGYTSGVTLIHISLESDYPTSLSFRETAVSTAEDGPAEVAVKRIAYYGELTLLLNLTETERQELLSLIEKATNADQAPVTE